MPNNFLASDTHLGHRLMERTRPWNTLEEHDEAIIANWNKVVSPKDLVWHLGDVVMNRNKLHLVGRLNGRKKLVMGNHDTHPIPEYLQYFEEVRACKTFEWAILTHIPVHPDQLGRFKFNIHGHLHAHTVGDPRYFNVSMEQINYTPIPVETVRDRLNAINHSC